MTIDPGLPTQETRTVLSVPAQQPGEPCPERVLHGAAPVRARGRGGRSRAGPGQPRVGFQPPYETEGKFEALEFAAGNYGLLESA